MPTKLFEPENLTPEYSPASGCLDVDAGGVVNNEGRIEVVAVERGIGLKVEEKIPRGDLEELGGAVEEFVRHWRASAGVLLAVEEARGLIRMLTRAVAVCEQEQTRKSRNDIQAA